jgi:hypothetical protein
MRRSSRLIIGLAAAAITFGSLAAIVGTDHWNHSRVDRWHGHWEHCEHHQDTNYEAPPGDPESSR